MSSAGWLRAVRLQVLRIAYDIVGLGIRSRQSDNYAHCRLVWFDG